MKVPKFLRGAPAAGEGEQPSPRRRRRTPRPDGPRTIVPDVAPGETPSWLKDRAPVAPASPLALDLDAARERLRRAIPPVDDEA